MRAGANRATDVYYLPWEYWVIGLIGLVIIIAIGYFIWVGLQAFKE